MYDQLLPANTVTVASTYNAIGFLPGGPRSRCPTISCRWSGAAATGSRCRPGSPASVSRPGPRRPGPVLQSAGPRNDPGRETPGRVLRGQRTIPDLRRTVRRFERCAAGSRRLRPASRESYEQLVFPIYFRTADELVEPVAAPNAGLAELFRLDRVESMEVPVPFCERLAQTGDVQAYAREFTGFLQAFTEPIIRMTFANEPELDSLIVDLYTRVEFRLASDPSGYAFHYIQGRPFYETLSDAMNSENPSSGGNARRYYGKYRGLVLENVDPEQFGRVIVQVPDVLGATPSRWALPCVPAAGIQAGFFVVPPVGSAIWVEFKQGDPDFPIWTGGYWERVADVPIMATAPLAVPPGQNMVLQTTGQNMLLLSNAPPNSRDRRHRAQEHQRSHDRGQRLGY